MPPLPLPLQQHLHLLLLVTMRLPSLLLVLYLAVLWLLVAALHLLRRLRVPCHSAGPLQLLQLMAMLLLLQGVR